MIITGDITQVDLPKGVQSGLRVANELLASVNGISIIHLNQTDVVRHPLVQKSLMLMNKQSRCTVSVRPQSAGLISVSQLASR